MRRLDGARIAQLRKQKGWDQYELAAAARIAPSVISRMERNLQQDFKVSVLAAVASALGTSLDSLLVPFEETRGIGFTAELEVVLAQVRQQPDQVQRHIAGM